jgi:hypothetical protein
MKKLIYGALALSVVMFSCNKQEITPEVVVNQTKANGKHRIFYSESSGGVITKAWCADIGGNCLDDVNVTASILPIINDGIDVIKTGNNSSIVDFFKNNKNNLISVLPEDCVTGVIEGTYFVDVFGDLNKKAYFQFISQKKELYKVVPLFE